MKPETNWHTRCLYYRSTIQNEGLSMMKIGRKTIVAILTGLFFTLETAGAVAASTSTSKTPWYAAWYLWIGLAVFVIALVTVMGASKERE